MYFQPDPDRAAQERETERQREQLAEQRADRIKDYTPAPPNPTTENPMFERFTERARQVVVFAEDEARPLGYHTIEPEHLLLGLLLEEEGLAAAVLTSRGFTADGVRDSIRMLPPTLADNQPEKPPFSAAAKKALELSLREALNLGHNYIGTEHILLGLTRQGSERVMEVLTERIDAPHPRDAAAVINNEVIRALSGRRKAPAPSIEDVAREARHTVGAITHVFTAPTPEVRRVAAQHALEHLAKTAKTAAAHLRGKDQ